MLVKIRQIFFIVLLSALSLVHSDTIDECQYNTSQIFSNDTVLITTKLNSVFDKIKKSARFFMPNLINSPNTINLYIEGSNYSVSPQNISHQFFVDKFTCNFANNLEFTLKPLNNSVRYTGEIFISQKPAGYYNVTFNNVTVSFALNTRQAFEEGIYDIKPSVDYFSFDIKFQSNAAGAIPLNPFISPLVQEIESNFKTYVTNHVNITLDNLKASLLTIIRTCQISLTELQPNTLYFHANVDQLIDSYPDVTFRVNSLIIEGLSNLKSMTFYIPLPDHYTEYKGVSTSENLTVYVDWQYSSKSGQSSSQKLKFLVDRLNIEGLFEIYNIGKYFTAVGFESPKLCQQYSNTLSSFAEQLLERRMEDIIKKTLSGICC